MLIDMMTGKPITRIPYSGDYARYMAAMTASEIGGIKARLNEMIDGTEIKTAG